MNKICIEYSCVNCKNIFGMSLVNCIKNDVKRQIISPYKTEPERDMSGLPENRITEFIHKHHIFTLATSANNLPYTCTCFYVYIDELNLFVFTSDFGTRHVDEMLGQPMVAGAVALETTMIGKIQGIQFTGEAKELKNELYETALHAYLKKFPVANFKKLVLWGIQPGFIKMTHNVLGFGKKLTWKNES